MTAKAEIISISTSKFGLLLGVLGLVGPTLWYIGEIKFAPRSAMADYALTSKLEVVADGVDSIRMDMRLMRQRDSIRDAMWYEYREFRAGRRR